MIEKKTWEEFRETGLLWLINTTLHVFGWCIVYETKTGEAYPARTKFRGFSNESDTKGYRMVSAYLQENIDTIKDEAFEEEQE